MQNIKHTYSHKEQFVQEALWKARLLYLGSTRCLGRTPSKFEYVELSWAGQAASEFVDPIDNK